MSHSSELIAKDIEAYLKIHENKDLLRFLTCGNVDDGKSTLIGRLLYDSKLIYEDQMAAIKKDSQKFNTTDEAFDLALLVDGLQSEREQGLPLMLPTVTFLRINASSSLWIPRVMNSTPEIWLRVLLTAIWQLLLWMPVTVFRLKPAAIAMYVTC